MGINMKVTPRIVVNGKTYESPEQMPPDVRAIYDKAMAQEAAHPGTIKRTGKVTFNGKEYDNPEQMPPEIRQLYDDALKALHLPPATDAGSQSSVKPATMGAASPVRPAGYNPVQKTSSVARLATMLAIGLTLLLLVLLVMKR